MRSKLDTIQCLRGAACLLVLLFHGALTEAKFWPASDYKFLSAFQFGFAGVDLFFVISGFIITWVTYDQIGRRSIIPIFVAKRALRIYPVFWIVYALLGVAIYYDVGMQYMPDYMTASAHVKALLLIPQDSSFNLVVPVSWTLVHEVLFYAIFCIIIALPRPLMPAALAVWTGFIVASSEIGFGSGSWLAYYVVSPLNLEFILGCAAALLTKRGYIAQPSAVFSIGCVLFIGCGVVANTSPGALSSYYARVFAFGFPSFLIILGLAGIEKSRTFDPPRALILLGNASYSIYVVHLGIFQAVRRFTIGVETPFGPEWGLITQIVWVAFLVLSGLAGGLLLHFVAEKPIMSASARLIGHNHRGEQRPVMHRGS